MISSPDFIKNELIDASSALTELLRNNKVIANIELASQIMTQAIKLGGRIYACGNGGSLCDAMHFAEELTGRYRKNRPPLPATAIADASHLACVANDFGYLHVFSRWIQAHGRSGDVLVAISTSGKSPNVIEAVRVAKKNGLKVIALTGVPDCELGECSDVHIACKAGNWADRVQELHIKIIHIWIALIERELYPDLYK